MNFDYRISNNLLALHDPNRKKANLITNTSENLSLKALSTTDLDKIEKPEKLSSFASNSDYSKKPSSSSKNLTIEDPYKIDHRYTNTNTITTTNKNSILKDNKDYNPTKDIKTFSKKK